MKYLAAVLIAGCAAAPTKPEPVAFDIGNLSIRCLMQGMILRYVVTEGDTITKAICHPPPDAQRGSES